MHRCCLVRVSPMRAPSHCLAASNNMRWFLHPFCRRLAMQLMNSIACLSFPFPFICRIRSFLRVILCAWLLETRKGTPETPSTLFFLLWITARTSCAAWLCRRWQWLDCRAFLRIECLSVRLRAIGAMEIIVRMWFPGSPRDLSSRLVCDLEYCIERRCNRQGRWFFLHLGSISCSWCLKRDRRRSAAKCAIGCLEKVVAYYRE